MEIQNYMISWKLGKDSFCVNEGIISDAQYC